LIETPVSTERVDVGVIPTRDVAVGPAGAREHAPILRNLLLQVEAHAGPAGIGAHRRQRVAGVQARRFGQRDSGVVVPHPPADEKTGDLELAGLSPQLVSVNGTT